MHIAIPRITNIPALVSRIIRICPARFCRTSSGLAWSCLAWFCIVTFGVVSFCFASSLAAVPLSQFDVRSPRGLDFVLQNSPTPQKYLIETMPGGVALLDYNNDGLLDIFLVNGGHVTNPMSIPEKFDRKNPRYWNRLYRQNKDGSFTDVTQCRRPGRCRRRQLRHGCGRRRL